MVGCRELNIASEVSKLRGNDLDVKTTKNKHNFAYL